MQTQNRNPVGSTTLLEIGHNRRSSPAGLPAMALAWHKNQTPSGHSTNPHRPYGIGITPLPRKYLVYTVSAFSSGSLREPIPSKLTRGYSEA